MEGEHPSMEERRIASLSQQVLLRLGFQVAALGATALLAASFSFGSPRRLSRIFSLSHGLGSSSRSLAAFRLRSPVWTPHLNFWDECLPIKGLAVLMHMVGVAQR